MVIWLVVPISVILTSIVWFVILKVRAKEFYRKYHIIGNVTDFPLGEYWVCPQDSDHIIVREFDVYRYYMVYSSKKLNSRDRFKVAKRPILPHRFIITKGEDGYDR